MSYLLLLNELFKYLLLSSIFFDFVLSIILLKYQNIKIDIIFSFVSLLLGIFQEYYLRSIPTGYLYFYINVIFNFVYFKNKKNKSIKRIKLIIILFIFFSLFFHRYIFFIFLINTFFKIFFFYLIEKYRIKLKTILSVFLAATIINNYKFIEPNLINDINFMIIDIMLNIIASFFLVRNGIIKLKIVKFIKSKRLL